MAVTQGKTGSFRYWYVYMREFPSDSKRQGCQLKVGGVRQRVGDTGEMKGCERDGEREGLDLQKNTSVLPDRMRNLREVFLSLQRLQCTGPCWCINVS